ncbi:S-adenosyl-L-methionine-dependent methyltransferase [Trametes meyenii]|nr:S-adenosyl-L-methionine-dependent methyltransferase [Trametes meyenii]
MHILGNSEWEVPEDDDFYSHFLESSGRLFSSRTDTYPLPVDTMEQERQRQMHLLLHHVVPDLYYGPIHSRLIMGKSIRVLDVGTGTGDWIIELAQEYRNAMFIGMDIVPVCTRYQPPNVSFQIQDFREGLSYQSRSMDIVHARFISSGLLHYDSFVGEVARVLDNQGLFSTVEWTRSLCMADGTDAELHAPHASAFLRAVREALEEGRSIGSVSSRIPFTLLNSGFFGSIVAIASYVPVGSWSECPRLRFIGSTYCDVLIAYASSMRPFLERSMSPLLVEDLVQGYVSDLLNIRGLFSVFCVVHAVRAR